MLLVTPHTGVWIETLFPSTPFILGLVTPHTGVWIETCDPPKCELYVKSRPTRACGLKQMYGREQSPHQSGHAPHGRVD